MGVKLEVEHERLDEASVKEHEEVGGELAPNLGFYYLHENVQQSNSGNFLSC